MTDHNPDAMVKAQPAPAPLPQRLYEGQFCNQVGRGMCPNFCRVGDDEASCCLTTPLKWHLEGWLRTERCISAPNTPAPLPENATIILHTTPPQESEVVDHLLRELVEARRTIATQAQRLAEVKATLRDHDAMTTKLVAFERVKADAAEARVRELEAESAGRFEHIVKVESERDALRERVRELEAELEWRREEANQYTEALNAAKERNTELLKRLLRTDNAAALVAANYTEDFVTEPERRAQGLPLLGVGG